MEQEKQTYKNQKRAWLNLNQQMVTVRDSAGNLYSFQNPFNNRIASSSDESILTATADRTAVEKEVSILVKRVAARTAFCPSPCLRTTKPPPAPTRFRVGEEEVRINFRGGTLKELADAINTKSEVFWKLRWSATARTPRSFSSKARKRGPATP